MTPLPPPLRTRLKRILALNPFAVAAFGVFAMLFLLWPDLDLAIHRYFYHDGAFFLKDHPLVQTTYHAVPVVAKLTVALLLIAIVSGAALHLARRRAWWLKPSLYLFACLVIGPGLAVNGVLKEHWGRARPSQIEEFGGTQQYTPPWHITNECESNCSFVSGHASVGFFFIAVALLLKGRARAIAMMVAILLGLSTGLGRIAQGGHFFSDVIFCGFIVYAVSRWLWNLILDPNRTA